MNNARNRNNPTAGNRRSIMSILSILIYDHIFVAWLMGKEDGIYRLPKLAAMAIGVVL